MENPSSGMYEHIGPPLPPWPPTEKEECYTSFQNTSLDLDSGRYGPSPSPRPGGAKGFAVPDEGDYAEIDGGLRKLGNRNRRPSDYELVLSKKGVLVTTEESHPMSPPHKTHVRSRSVNLKTRRRVEIRRNSGSPPPDYGMLANPGVAETGASPQHFGGGMSAVPGPQSRAGMEIIKNESFSDLPPGRPRSVSQAKNPMYSTVPVGKPREVRDDATHQHNADLGQYEELPDRPYSKPVKPVPHAPSQSSTTGGGGEYATIEDKGRRHDDHDKSGKKNGKQAYHVMYDIESHQLISSDKTGGMSIANPGYATYDTPSSNASARENVYNIVSNGSRKALATGESGRSNPGHATYDTPSNNSLARDSAYKTGHANYDTPSNNSLARDSAYKTVGNGSCEVLATDGDRANPGYATYDTPSNNSLATPSSRPLYDVPSSLPASSGGAVRTGPSFIAQPPNLGWYDVPQPSGKAAKEEVNSAPSYVPSSNSPAPKLDA